MQHISNSNDICRIPIKAFSLTLEDQWLARVPDCLIVTALECRDWCLDSVAHDLMNRRQDPSDHPGVS
jgi:hypothetical protein